jgi:hypothetical protein
MTRRSLTLLAIAGLVLLVAAPLPAQTIRLKASIPFEFVAGTQTLPAGDYAIDTTEAQGVVRVRNQSTHETSAVLSNSANEPRLHSNPDARLVFHRYGDRYFLSQIWDGYEAVGREIPTSKAERALTESAISRAPETLVILARR